MNNILFPNSFTIKPDNTMQLGQTGYKLDYIKKALSFRQNIIISAVAIIVIAIILIGLLKLIGQLNKAVYVCFITLILLVTLALTFICNSDITDDYVNETGIRLKQTNFTIKQIPKDKYPFYESKYTLAKNIETGKTTTLTNYKLYAKVKQDQKEVYLGTIKNNKINFSNNSASALLKKYSTFIQNKHLENDFKNNSKLIYDIDYLDQSNQPQLVLKGKNNKTLHLATYNNKVQIN